MVNPYKLTDGRKFALIQGYVIDVKDRGDVNMLLFKKDTQDPSSKLISVAAWALAEGQSGADMREMTKDTKVNLLSVLLRFVIRKKTESFMKITTLRISLNRRCRSKRHEY